MTDPFDTPAMTGGATDIPRDRYGRPLIQPPGGGKPIPYTRATTIADTLDDRYNLERWKMRQVAAGLAARKDLVALAAAKQNAYLRALDTQDEAKQRAAKRDLDQICDDATSAAASGAAANLGTALHEFIESINRGVEPANIPDDLRDDIDAFRNAMQPFEVVAAEQFLVLDEQRIAGTADFIIRHTASGRLYIGDLKTGAGAVTFGQQSIAAQLAIYSRGSIYHPDTHDREPILVEQDRALVVHLPARSGKCTVHEVDIAAGWEAVQHAIWTRQWRNHRNLFQAATFAYMEPTNPPQLKVSAKPAPPTWVELIAQADTVAELEALYLDAVKDGADPAELVPLCKTRKQHIVGAA